MRKLPALFLDTQAPVIYAQAIMIVHRAYSSQDEIDIMFAELLVQEYARMWYAMRTAAFVCYGCMPPTYAGDHD